MDILYASAAISFTKQEIRQAFHEILEKKFPDHQDDTIYSLAYDKEDQIYLKAGNGLVWGKIFFEKLMASDFSLIQHELENITQAFSRDVQPCLFFPDIDARADELLSKYFTKTLAYQYQYVESESKRGIAVKEKSGIIVPAEQVMDYSKMARVTREELAELIEISLSLRIESEC